MLNQLSFNLEKDGILIVALPNILHWKQRVKFLKGDFKYTDGGIMDKTHFRFFDWDTAYQLVQSSEFKITDYIADGYFPLPIIRSLINPMASYIDKYAIKINPGLFATQFIIIGQFS